MANNRNAKPMTRGQHVHHKRRRERPLKWQNQQRLKRGVRWRKAQEENEGDNA